MAAERGMLAPDELGAQVAAGAIDTVIVAFTDLYGRLMGKRCDAGFFLEHVAAEGSHACDYLLAVDVGMEPVQGYAFANWEKGYGDMHLVPDLSTLRRAAWLDRTALVLCDVPQAEPAPRTVLRRQIERAAALGFAPMAGSELELYLFDDDYREADRRGHDGLTPAGWYIEDYHILQGTRVEPLFGEVRRALRDSGVPVETTKGEWGLGQHELNLRYAGVLEMADRHVIFKQCCKEVALRQGKSVTFMAKPFTERAGSSCHLHLSLWRDGTNAFAGDPPSDLFRWFLGGWIAGCSDLMALYAPNPNSYKRYQAGSWAPTRLAWAHDNRTAAFRCVGRGESLRIECRVPGADCNPYLAFAAALAAGLDGIERRTEPPEICAGDAYHAADQPRLPGSLREATLRLERSDLARAAFGPDLVAHLAKFFRTEQTACDRAVTDWDRRRYFEQI